jgi:aspartate/methionine/tyrosine aminotransferase
MLTISTQKHRSQRPSRIVQPNGHATDTDPVMLMSQWVETLQQESPQTSFIRAGIGKPSLAAHPKTIAAMLDYWQNLQGQESGRMVSYGHPQGDLNARQTIAKALEAWYDHAADINADQVLFTTGAVAGLYCAFDVVNTLVPNGRIIVPTPHYHSYKGSRDANRLFAVNLFDAPGYRFSAKSLKRAIAWTQQLAKSDGGHPSALVLCNPHNPTGVALTVSELEAIAEVLRQHPDILVFLDEAYAEMTMDGSKAPSLLTVAPDLKNQMLIFRSGTKAMSMAGERMAVTVCFNPAIMSELTKKHIDICGHAPRSTQHAYAQAFHHLDATELKRISNHYTPKVQYVSQRVQDLGITLPDTNYKTESTFYVLVNLRELLGTRMDPQSLRAFALGRDPIIHDDQDLAYDLLFKDRVMISPLSFNGAKASQGYMRITCSADQRYLEQLMNVIESRLIDVRSRNNH